MWANTAFFYAHVCNSTEMFQYELCKPSFVTVSEGYSELHSWHTSSLNDSSSLASVYTSSLLFHVSILISWFLLALLYLGIRVTFPPPPDLLSVFAKAKHTLHYWSLLLSCFESATKGSDHSQLTALANDDTCLVSALVRCNRFQIDF